MKKSKKSLLIACVLGDGYIAKSSNSKSCTLEIIHSNKQKEYIEWKADLLRKATGKKIPLKEKMVTKRTIVGKETPELLAYRITCTHKYFRVLRKWLYPNNKKKLSPKYIQYLDPLGLSIWYMDDGSTFKSKTSEQVSMEISTHVSLEDAEELIKFFKEKWGVTFHLHKKKKDQYNIRLYKNDSYIFRDIIKSHVPECMNYKIDF